MKKQHLVARQGLLQLYLYFCAQGLSQIYPLYEGTEGGTGCLDIDCFSHGLYPRTGAGCSTGHQVYGI